MTCNPTGCFCTGACRETEEQRKHRELYNEVIERIKKDKEAMADRPCLWDSLSEEDKAKPMGLSCPCRKCSTWAYGST